VLSFQRIEFQSHGIRASMLEQCMIYEVSFGSD